MRRQVARTPISKSAFRRRCAGGSSPFRICGFGPGSALRAERAARAGTIDAVCEECGKPSTFPASQGGTVQDCPYCRKCMDAPDPKDEWNQDFGTADAEP